MIVKYRSLFDGTVNFGHVVFVDQYGIYHICCKSRINGYYPTIDHARVIFAKYEKYFGRFCLI